MPEVSSNEWEVEIVDHDTNNLTGHLTVHVRSTRKTGENSIERGPMKSYGIDPDSLEITFEGDVDKWLEFVKTRHQRFSGVNRQAATRVASLKGKIL